MAAAAPAAGPNGGMITTLADCCPRCGYVLDQPAPPARASRAPPPPPPVLSYAEPFPAPTPPPHRRVRRPQRRLGAQDPARPRRHLPARRGRDLPGRGLVLARHRRPHRGAGRAHRRDRAGGPVAGPPRPRGRRRGAHHRRARPARAGPGRRPSMPAGSAAADRRVVRRHASGGTSLVASVGLCLPDPRLFVPQLAAPLGLVLVVLGVAGATQHAQVVAPSPSLGYAALALARPATRRRRAALDARSPVHWLAFAGLAWARWSTPPTTRPCAGCGSRATAWGCWRSPRLALLPWLLFRGQRRPASAGLRGLGIGADLHRRAAGARRGRHRDHPRRGRAARWSGRVVAARLRRGGTPCRGCPLAGSLLVLVPVPVGLAAERAREPVHGRRRRSPRTRRSGWTRRTHVAHPLLLPLGGGRRRARRGADRAAAAVRSAGRAPRLRR